MQRDNARVGRRSARSAESAFGLRAAEFHLHRCAHVGPLLLHIPTSRLFCVSSALADCLTSVRHRRTPVVDRQPNNVRIKGTRPASPDGAEGKPTRAVPRPGNSRHPARGRNAGDAPDLSRAIAELRDLCRRDRAGQFRFPAPRARIAPPDDPTCATSSPQPLSLPGRGQGEGEDASTPTESARGVRWGDLTLFITDRCNLRCEYCFESYASLRAAGRTISRDTAASALDFFFDRLYPGAEVYDLHLFGGEPLLEWDMVEWVTREARRRAEQKGSPLYLSVSTNAIGLTAQQAAFLREHEFDVSVSFDGPSEVHDAFRKFRNGRGSLAAARHGLAYLLEGRPPYTSVAGRMHRGNTDVFKSFLAAYEATGGKHGIACTLARPSPEHPLRLREEDVDEVLASYRRLADFIIQQMAKGEYGPLTALIIGNDYLGRFVPRLKTRSRGNRRCGAGLSLFVVATDGGVYPCRSLVGREEYRLGDVWNGIDKARHEPWLHLAVEQRDECKECWARYLCGGGCYAQAAIACGSPARPNPVECRYTRGLMELTMELIARLENEAPGRLDEALAELVFNLPEKHRVFVPAALQAQPGAPRIEAIEIEPRVVAPGGTVRGRVAVRTRRPLAAVTVYDSGGGTRALTLEGEAGDAWPQTLWFSGDDTLRADAPLGRYWVGVAAVDSSGAISRAFTCVDVVSGGAAAVRSGA